MTFGVAVQVASGVVALADTRVVRGEQHATKAKLSTIEHAGGQALVITSGLRSVRDKTLLRLDDQLAANTTPCTRLHDLASRYGAMLRDVRAEDAAALETAGLSFNVHTIIGGQMADDPGPGLFLVYPEGNWIAATPDVPYFIVGRTAYGKPILDRLLDADTDLRTALNLVYLAFDATRASVVDVDFPVDVIAFAGGNTRQCRLQAADLADTHEFWTARLAAALADLPDAWTACLLTDLATEHR